MYSLVVFLVLCLLEYGLFTWKRAEVNEYQDVARGIASFSDVDDHKVYRRSVIFLSNLLNVFRKFWLPVLLFICFVNAMVAIIIGTITFYIVNIF
jgi:hypothetical protein